MKGFKIFNIIFVLLLVLPTLLYIPFKSHMEEENNENRELAEKPEFSFSTIEDYPSEFEAYYNDHLPFRNLLISINSDFKYNVLKTVNSEKVIKGKEDWLFYKSTLEDYKGENSFSYNELKYTALHMNTVSDKFKELETDFVILIVPNKNTVYPEYMMDYYTPSSRHRINDMIDNLEKNTDVNVVYGLNALNNAKEICDLFFHGDTHTNNTGSFVLANEVYKATGDTSCDLLPSNIDKDHAYAEGRDLKKMLNLFDTSENAPDIIDWSVVEPSQKYKKVLIIGDSFIDTLKFSFNEKYEDITYVHWDDYTTDVLTDDVYDLVICESVERYAFRLFNINIP